MKGLLMADFSRVLRDKLLLVLGILAVVFAVITPLLYVLIFSFSGEGDAAEMEMLFGSINAKTQFFASFSLGNNLGLIAPVLLAIVLCKDFSFGTIRNKIIAGKKRSEIYLSLFITCSVFLIAVILLSAFITLFFSLIFFDYQAEPFKASDFWYFLESLLYELLVLLFVSALISWLVATMKNVGLVIVLCVAINFVLVMLSSIMQIATMTIELAGANETLVELLRTIDRLNVGSNASYIGMGTSYTLEDRLYLTIPVIMWTVLFFFLGLLKFRKKDIK